MRKIPLTHKSRILALSVLCGLPGSMAALLLLLTGDYDAKVYLTVFILVGVAWIIFARQLVMITIQPLQTASNMLSALREGDFSLHSGYAHPTDPLGQLMLEINQLTDVLAEHRMDAIEAHTLMEKVLQEIDAAVMTFDPDRRLTLANSAALRMLGLRREQIHFNYAAELDLDPALDSLPDATIAYPAGSQQRYTIRKGIYHVGGQPHELLILIDVSKTLRDEELLAWKRLIRVLGHELNNSMAPIRSLSESLQKIARKAELDAEDRQDISDGLEIIRQRSDNLSRFMDDYTRLAKLPQPQRQPIDLRELIEHCRALLASPVIEIADDLPEFVFAGDPVQLEQALLNLLKNAVEADRKSVV